MKEEIDFRSRKGSIVFLAVLVFGAVCIMPAAAIELPGYNMLSIPVLNDQHHVNGQYYFTIGNNLTNGGMNAVHISNSYSNPSGQLNRLTEYNGTFFITDTGGKGYEDEAILLIAVESSEANQFSIHIKSEGYHTIDHAASMAPTFSEITANGYLSPAHEADYTSSQFLKDYWSTNSTQIVQKWKPASPPFENTNGYLWNDQTPNDGEFKLMFIDLNTTIVGSNSPYDDQLINNGCPKITYNISPGYTGKVVFIPYGWVNYTTGGGSYFDDQVGWTSRANGTYASDWLVTLT